jgi:hypothetical protein
MGRQLSYTTYVCVCERERESRTGRNVPIFSPTMFVVWDVETEHTNCIGKYKFPVRAIGRMYLVDRVCSDWRLNVAPVVDQNYKLHTEKTEPENPCCYNDPFIALHTLGNIGSKQQPQ